MIAIKLMSLFGFLWTFRAELEKITCYCVWPCDCNMTSLDTPANPWSLL